MQNALLSCIPIRRPLRYGNDHDHLDFMWKLKAELSIGTDRAAAPGRQFRMIFCDYKADSCKNTMLLMYKCV